MVLSIVIARCRRRRRLTPLPSFWACSWTTRRRLLLCCHKHSSNIPPPCPLLYTQLDYEDSLRKQAAESDGEGSGSEADGPGKLRLASKVDLNRCTAGGLPGACSGGHVKGGGA